MKVLLVLWLVDRVCGAAPFYAGADLSQWADQGVYYFANGSAADPFVILRDGGATAVRLRLWVDPDDPSHYAVPSGSNLSATLASARRAHAAGLAICLDLHYSDVWADPGAQTKPQAWARYDLDTLVEAVRSYTYNVTHALTAAGTPPALVQIGNEITSGMLWDTQDCWSGGQLWVASCDGGGHFDALAQLLRAGIDGARAALGDGFDGIVIHLDAGSDPSKVMYWFDQLAGAGVSWASPVTDYDHIGLSYYQRWSGRAASVANITQLWSEIAARFPDKGLIMAETDYAYAPPSDPASWPQPPEFGYDPEGQAAFAAASIGALRSLPTGRGLFWWGAELRDGYSGARAGLWDESGVALPAVLAFGGSA